HTAPANPYDLSAEFGRAAFDRRRQVFISGTLSLPWGIDVNPLVSAASGRPFNITTGRDNNGDTFFTDRPAFASPGDPDAIVTSFGVFNPNPRPGDPIIPRNFGDGPGQVSINLNFSKTFGFGPKEVSSPGGNRPNSREGGGRGGGIGGRGGFGGGLGGPGGGAGGPGGFGG